MYNMAKLVYAITVCIIVFATAGNVYSTTGAVGNVYGTAGTV